MTIPSSSVLYYPHIDIRNERWLRTAALFWDSIQTIAPASLREPYSTDLARELSGEGILEPIRISPRSIEVESIGDTVLDFITDPASAGVLLQTDGQHAERIHVDKLPRELAELARIHPQKLPYFIQQHLEDHLNSEGWYEVSQGFSSFYMTLLASRIASTRGLGLVTESNSADQLATAVQKGKPLSQRDTSYRHDTLPRELAPGMLFEVTLRGIELPRRISVRDLIRFKHAHSEELATFREELTNLTSEFPDDLTVEAMRQAVNDQYKTRIRPALKSIRQSLRAQGWNAALSGFLKASFFTSGPTTAAAFMGIPNNVALVAGVGVSIAAAAVLWTTDRQRTLLESPYSYLLALENEWR